MKKILIPFLALTLFLFQSCEETQSPTYDGSQTLAYFDGSGATLEVEINSTGSITVPLGVSTLSTSDRTVNISVAADDTTATSGQYSFPATVTIPANSYTGSFTLTGMDDGLTTAGVNLDLQIDSVDGGVGSTQLFSVNIVEICPVDAAFAIGDYTLDFVSGGVAAAGFAPAMGDGVTVTLRAGGSSTERIFTTKFYPSFQFSNPPADFSFNFVCAETTINGIPSGQASGVGCGGSIAFGPAATLGTYDVADDTTITLVFTEDTEEICGASATTTYTLTKI